MNYQILSEVRSGEACGLDADPHESRNADRDLGSAASVTAATPPRSASLRDRPARPPLMPLFDAWSWQLAARCRNEDPAIFFGADGERGDKGRRRQQRAKAICAQCPVISDCRAHSLKYQERFGIWGGMSESEREHATDPKRSTRRPEGRLNGSNKHPSMTIAPDSGD